MNYFMIYSVPEDMTLNGYYVPKGSYILVNLWFILHDPRYFEEPLKFKPERFFIENGRVVKNLEGFLPFSIGKIKVFSLFNSNL